MKTFFRLFGAITLTAIIGFGAISCDQSADDPIGGETGDTESSNSNGTPATPQPFNDITAAQLVANIRIGWNLGNTLEAAHMTWLGSNPTVQQMETGWGNLVTTKANITAIKNAGFNAIRLPVTWTKAAGGAPNYTIRADWMARVVEIVNYAVDNDMYILLNSHHDEEDVYGFMNSDAAAGKAAFGKIWEQVADTFKNYNEKLIFEGLNEPRTVGSANEWSGGTAEERNNLNAYYQIFVDKVRASGGNNGKRILQINTYGSNSSQAAVDGLILPTDTVPNKLIVAFHMYEPFTFCYNQDGSVTTWSASNTADTSPITQAMDRFYSKYIQNNIPVIIGECGTQNKNNTSAREAWTEFYFSYAWSKGIKCFIFDNGITAIGGSSSAEEAFGIFKRSNNTFDYPGILQAMLNGTTGAQGGNPSEMAAVFTSWDTGKDDASSITYTTPSGRHKITGTVGNTEGSYASLTASPNAATLTKMKTMTSFSFMASGDSNQYDVMIVTSDTVAAGHNHYRYTFTVTGTETKKTINMSSLAQADWGGAGVTSFNQNNIQSIQFQRVGSGSFDLTVSDVTLY